MSKFLVDWETPPFLQQGKSCINFAIKLPTLTHISSSVYTTKHLRKIRRLGYKQFLYLLYVNSLKKFFVSKTKFNCFEKMAIFSYSLLPGIFKFRRSSLRLVFLIKKISNNKSRVLEIALQGGREWKGGRNGNFSRESINHSVLLSC